ncbi:MAG TPA: hypothetical protein VHA82_10565 [Ramlibacter sp.]|uniref:hypothetical protein n=1 Tax=Ramlibacter sp. TaxID=1917967 RepID=UPI002BAF0D1D|nr:hypothetical protein [Ramlibacter sp.]HVZ44240.1 hypothetical protein [Ramlibacter sp.]
MQAAARFLSRILAAIDEACAATLGRPALEYVRLPAGLAYAPHERARRHVRTAQLSTW